MTEILPTISLIMPTRKRPDRALFFLKSAYDKARNSSEIEIVLYVDDDDDCYNDFCSPFEQTKIIHGPRLTMSMCNRRCADESSGDILFFINDDIEVETFDWDSSIRIVHSNFEDSIYLCYPNDCFKGDKLAVFPIISRTFYDRFPIFPDHYKGSFIDAHIHETFKLLKKLGSDRINYRKDIIFRHKHYRVTGEKPDKTYTDRVRFGDDKVFLRGVFFRQELAKKIREFIETKKEFITPFENNLETGSVLSAILFYLFSVSADPRYRISICIKFMMRFGYTLILAKKRT